MSAVHFHNKCHQLEICSQCYCFSAGRISMGQSLLLPLHFEIFLQFQYFWASMQESIATVNIGWNKRIKLNPLATFFFVYHSPYTKVAFRCKKREVTAQYYYYYYCYFYYYLMSLLFYADLSINVR